MKTMIGRRELLVGGGAVVAATAFWPSREAVPRAGRVAGNAAVDGLRRDYAAARDGVLERWWDPQRGTIRPTNGGDPHDRTGMRDPRGVPSFWQMACLENALFNDADLDPAGGSRRRVAEQWRYITAGVPAFTPRVLAGDGRGLTINLSDDAAWQCWYLMHAHMMTGDTRALAWLAEATAATRARFLDRDAGNPTITFGRTPTGRPIATNRYGILYVEDESPDFKYYGRLSSSVEAVLALTELYVYRALGIPAYRECAQASYRWIYEKLRTPPSDDPAAKAEGLYETELCLARSGGTAGDRQAAYLKPVAAFWGKPIRGLDSTYLSSAMAMALLAERLAGLPGTAAADRRAYRTEAVHIANTLPRPNAYGRDVGGRRLIANTRDPWSEAFTGYPFAKEVLSLPGVAPATRAAFADTARHILRSARDVEGRLTADWAGPERNFLTGRSTWEEDYRAQPGNQAGAAQIMTEGQTLAMVQAGVAAAAMAG
ncbi:hypothetical protein ACFSGX_05420 [Sphingomonas arantia]|uniref:Uncharacterized protein n=1 Tax=Sphingomonas arantia TaxID=1460676 RepID=A0ABW4TU32_9SPHN